MRRSPFLDVFLGFTLPFQMLRDNANATYFGSDTQNRYGPAQRCRRPGQIRYRSVRSVASKQYQPARSGWLILPWSVLTDAHIMSNFLF
jgi:hypothetical protein